MHAVQHELILGGAKSGKSRAAEERAAQWLRSDPARRAILVATALSPALTGDEEMRRRIARHRAERAARIPDLQTVEAASALGRVLRELADPERLIVIDCLTLWMTQCILPPEPLVAAPVNWEEERAGLIEALRLSESPLVLVSNEIGFGVMPVSSPMRAFIDDLGALHQEVAARCARVTLMVAGCELRVKTPGGAHS